MNDEPYPEFDAIGGFMVVIEPIGKYQERVWFAGGSQSYYFRYTAAWLDLESARAGAARLPATPGPIGSRFD